VNPIGGEIEAKDSKYNYYFTDSGRSSLRLFLRSFDNREKKYLIPNFGCQIIEDIFIQESIEYEFYTINDKLDIDIESISSKEYDVLYIINYFGLIHNLNLLHLNSKIIIEDNVFFDNFKNNSKHKYWFAFNSYRKISSLSDGSMIKTNLEIDIELIQKFESPFVEFKSKAKDIKFDFKHQNIGKESEYLSYFVKGEAILDSQREIYSISDKSIYRLKYEDISNNQNVLKDRFDYVSKVLDTNLIKFNPKYYSFAILNIENRDIIRQKLRDKNIFLPIHWNSTHSLSKNILSIALFSNYSDDEFKYMIDTIKELL